MNDDDLRSILHEEGDRIEPGDHSWSRLESRLQPAKRSAERSRAFALGTVAIAVVVSLAAVVLWVGREQPRTQVAVVPRPGPARILAVKGDGWLVLLDARTGTELRRYLANPAPGTPIAVSPDARHFYFASGDGNAGCQRETIQRRPIDPGPGSATVATGAIEPAISPDGRYLAYYHCLPGDDRPDELVVRDLALRRDRVWPAAAPDFFGERLVFDSDSRHLIIEVNRDRVGSAGRHRRLNTLYRFDTSDGAVLPGLEVGVAPWAFFGPRGSTGSYLGRFHRLKKDPVVVMRPTDPLNPKVFSAGVEFFLPGSVQAAVSDATGDQVLAVADDTLYRWSRGDKKPTKIRTGIVAAAWIPDRALPVAPADLLVARVSKSRVRSGDRLTMAVAVAVGLGEPSVTWTPDPLLLERRQAGRWDLVSSVTQRSFETPSVGQPGGLGGIPQTRFRVPRVKAGRYRICSEVSTLLAELWSRVKVCVPLTITRE